MRKYDALLETLIRMPYSPGVPIWAIAHDIYGNHDAQAIRMVMEHTLVWRLYGARVMVYEDAGIDPPGNTCIYLDCDGRSRKRIERIACEYYDRMYADQFLKRAFYRDDKGEPIAPGGRRYKIKQKSHSSRPEYTGLPAIMNKNKSKIVSDA